jgi:hypothetical protein
MKIKLIDHGDGSPLRVVDADTGEPVQFVKKVRYTATVDKLPLLTLQILNPPVDIVCNNVQTQIEEESAPTTRNDRDGSSGDD